MSRNRRGTGTLRTGSGWLRVTFYFQDDSDSGAGNFGFNTKHENHFDDVVAVVAVVAAVAVVSFVVVVVL